MEKAIISETLSQTRKIAKELASKILKTEKKSAVVIGLTGELGSGKTTFVQSFATALSIKERVISPTFVVMKIYKLSDKKFEHLIHIDAYRLSKAEEILELGWKEIIKNQNNIILVEWSDKIKKVLLKEYIKIKLEHLDKNKRKILIK